MDLNLMKPVVVAFALVIAVGNAVAGDLPNPTLTPGAINQDVTQDNIHDTVCVKGWTKSIRPPMHYTNSLKKKQIREYGYEDTDPRHYEEDHLIPLSVGGNPNDPKNLWPEPRKSEWSADRKDELEFALYKGVCNGDVTLDAARRAFATNWIDAYRHYALLLQRYRIKHFSD
ncbi:hypothetical protein [Burkholderia cepacia]|uniref:hypothetical protein n=1 Tax=Burkholderia cepacia TaxID=292 RepID=UPI002AB5ED76|nr:hypothetical protein [Burkholderia cepacia]